jgi:hypothetical protein
MLLQETEELDDDPTGFTRQPIERKSPGQCELLRSGLQNSTTEVLKGMSQSLSLCPVFL